MIFQMYYQMVIWSLNFSLEPSRTELARRRNLSPLGIAGGQWEGRMLAKIHDTIVFKRGAHLLEWPEVCRRWSGDGVTGAVCWLGSHRMLQGAGSKTCWRLCPSHVSEPHPRAHHVSSAGPPPTFWICSDVLGVSCGSSTTLLFLCRGIPTPCGSCTNDKVADKAQKHSSMSFRQQSLILPPPLCVPGSTAQPLWASVSLPVKWGD